MPSKLRQMTKIWSILGLITLLAGCSTEEPSDPFLVSDLVGSYTNGGMEKLSVGGSSMSHVFDIGLEFAGTCVATLSYDYVADPSSAPISDK